MNTKNLLFINKLNNNTNSYFNIKISYLLKKQKLIDF